MWSKLSQTPVLDFPWLGAAAIPRLCRRYRFLEYCVSSEKYYGAPQPLIGLTAWSGTLSNARQWLLRDHSRPCCFAPQASAGQSTAGGLRRRLGTGPYHRPLLCAAGLPRVSLQQPFPIARLTHFASHCFAPQASRVPYDRPLLFCAPPTSTRCSPQASSRLPAAQRALALI